MHARQYRPRDIRVLPEGYFHLNVGGFTTGDRVSLAKINQTWLMGNSASVRMQLNIIQEYPYRHIIWPN